ncbi:uncharacterized protein LOC144490514 [Mustelus asterias]
MSQEVSIEKYGDSFREAAVPLFVKSLSSLLAMFRIALHVGTRDLNEKDIGKFQEEIKQASKEAEKSAKCAEGLGDSIDEVSEKMTAEYGQVNRKSKDLSCTLQNHQNKLRSLEAEKELIQSKVQAAKLSLRQAEDSVRAARAKAGEKQTGRDVGIGLSFLLPCVGIPMAVAFEKERQYRKSEEDVASGDCSELKTSIRKDEEELNQISNQIPELYKQITEVSQSLEETKVAEEALKERRAELAKLQSRMRSCCQYLSTFQGKVGALKAQSQHMYNMRPLLPFLEEAGLHSQQVPDAEQLFNHIQLHRLIEDLLTLQPKIRELQLSEDSADDYMK